MRILSLWSCVLLSVSIGCSGGGPPEQAPAEEQAAAEAAPAEATEQAPAEAEAPSADGMAPVDTAAAPEPGEPGEPGEAASAAPSRNQALVPPWLPRRRARGEADEAAAGRCAGKAPSLDGEKRLKDLAKVQQGMICDYATCGVGGYGDAPGCEGGAGAYPTKTACLSDRFWERCGQLKVRNLLTCIEEAQSAPCGSAASVYGESVACAQVLACAAGRWTNPKKCAMQPPIAATKRLASLSRMERGLLCDYRTCAAGGYGQSVTCGDTEVPGLESRKACATAAMWDQCGDLKVSEYFACYRKALYNACDADKILKADPACAAVRACTGG